MTDKPILFSKPMIRALLDDRKTQTRRILKPQPADDFVSASWSAEALTFAPAYLFGTETHKMLRRLARPGDRLWVREATHRAPHNWFYSADDTQVGWPGQQAMAGGKRDKRPGMHLPRAASRLTLVVSQVRVQRLQEISEEDAIAEGSQEPSLVPVIGACWSERDAFAKLWRAINGPDAWDKNPWVVAYTGRAYRCNIDALDAVLAGLVR